MFKSRSRPQNKKYNEGNPKKGASLSISHADKGSTANKPHNISNKCCEGGAPTACPKGSTGTRGMNHRQTKSQRKLDPMQFQTLSGSPLATARAKIQTNMRMRVSICNLKGRPRQRQEAEPERLKLQGEKHFKI